MKTPFLCQARRLFVLALLPFVAATASESPSLLLEKGIYAEEIEQNLDSAIKIYSQIATEAAANRPVVAQAQYRLAMCYQKKGEKEQAIRMLNELSEQVAADPELSQKVRERLVELGQTPEENVKIQKVSTPPAGSFGTISPDGRWITYWPKNDQLEVVARELATGKTWTVQKVALRKDRLTHAYFSPDAHSIAYDVGEAAIYIANIDGTAARKVFPSGPAPTKIWVTLESWSADSKKILVANYDYAKNTRVATWVNINTGEANETVAVPYEDDGHSWSVSANGKLLARKTGQYPDPRKITLFDLATGRDEVVVERNAEEVVGWGPDDDSFVYSQKNSAGRIDLWSRAVKNGQPTGEPVLVKNNFFSLGYSAGITRDGSIYYAIPPKARPGQGNELWVMRGFLAKQPEAVAGLGEIPIEELLDSDNSLHDRLAGFSATLPTGWSLKRANRTGNGTTSLGFRVPGLGGNITAGLHFHAAVPGETPHTGLKWLDILGPSPSTLGEADIYVAKFAKHNIEAEKQGEQRYVIREGSLVVRRMSGNYAGISWVADFQRTNEPWVNYVTYVCGTKGGVVLPLRIPAEKLDAVRPAWDRFIESIRLP